MKAEPGRPAPSRPFGIVEWFRAGEHERTEAILPELSRAGVAHVRTHLSWAEYLSPGGPEWFDWLLPRLSERFEVLPCIHYTPPSLSRTGKTSGPPERLRDYADFIDAVLDRYGSHFRAVELWNEPNNLLDWDWRLDPSFDLFSEMIGDAAYWIRQRGWFPVLGGPSPFDPGFFRLMGERGILSLMHAVGIHGFPGTWDSEESSWSGWQEHVAELRAILHEFNPATEVWITETGYSTWRSDEHEQVRRFLAALAAPVERMYWYSWRDVPHHVAVQEGYWFDARHYHLGAVSDAGRPKLLARLLTDGGVPRVDAFANLAAPSVARRVRPVLITGGSGFVGSNLADSLLRDGVEVVVLDNLSRPGVDQNLAWLKDRHGARVHPIMDDIRDLKAIEPAFEDCRAVFHLAAQTAVTTSLDAPVDDFEVNARGTLNVLEAVRRSGRRLPIVFASTNKVYGSLADLEMIELEDRYMPADREIRRHGIGEARPLDFCTPYGCSKGTADQYVLDYCKSFDLPSAVLRMSCIYGPRQFGTEDQGWVAHFMIAAHEGRPITIFGDGKQVRDVLHVADAVRAYRMLMAQIEDHKGTAFNLGGGPANAVSLRLVLGRIEELLGRPVELDRAEWRPGDQPYFVADTRRIRAALGWEAQVDWRAGMLSLDQWIMADRGAGIRTTLSEAV
jgi:CDP-paratose 2-epimerase